MYLTGAIIAAGCFMKEVIISISYRKSKKKYFPIVTFLHIA
jgi:hypothetical protein